MCPQRQDVNPIMWDAGEIDTHPYSFHDWSEKVSGEETR